MEGIEGEVLRTDISNCELWNILIKDWKISLKENYIIIGHQEIYRKCSIKLKLKSEEKL